MRSLEPYLVAPHEHVGPGEHLDTPAPAWPKPDQAVPIDDERRGAKRGGGPLVPELVFARSAPTWSGRNPRWPCASSSSPDARFSRPMAHPNGDSRSTQSVRCAAREAWPRWAEAPLQAAVDRACGDRGLSHGHPDLRQSLDHVANGIETRHAAPLMVVDQEHAVSVVVGAEVGRQRGAPAQPERAVHGVEPEHAAAPAQARLNRIFARDHGRDRLPHQPHASLLELVVFIRCQSQLAVETQQRQISGVAA